MLRRVKVSSSGFTLVEVVAALGAFSIAFLAGFAAIGSLMIRQDINYRATVAASAAMMFLKEGKAKGYDLTDVNYEQKFMNTASGYDIPDQTRFRGYPVTLLNLTWVTNETDSYNGIEKSGMKKKIYTFKAGTAVDINGVMVDLSEYRPVLWTKIDGANQLAFWYGAPEEIEAARAATLDFLGLYSY